MREPGSSGVRSGRENSYFIKQLIRGRNNATGTVTLTASTTTTTVTRTGGNVSAQEFLFPKTANAAAELAAGGMYVSSITATGFVVTHANNAQVDRTFSYVVLGG